MQTRGESIEKGCFPIEDRDEIVEIIEMENAATERHFLALTSSVANLLHKRCGSCALVA